MHFGSGCYSYKQLEETRLKSEHTKHKSLTAFKYREEIKEYCQKKF